MPIASINPATGETLATFEALTEPQLEMLNAHGQVDIDLMQMGYHDLKREDIRIIQIKAAEDFELANPPDNGIVNVSLTYRHEGVSRLRRGGQGAVGSPLRAVHAHPGPGQERRAGRG